MTKPQAVRKVGGRPNQGLGDRSIEVKAGLDRIRRAEARASFETEQNERIGLKAPVVSASEIFRKGVDLYLAVYPPPGELPDHEEQAKLAILATPIALAAMKIRERREPAE